MATPVPTRLPVSTVASAAAAAATAASRCQYRYPFLVLLDTCRSFSTYTCSLPSPWATRARSKRVSQHGAAPYPAGTAPAQ